MRKTGLDLLAADLGTTPDRLVLYLLAFFAFVVIWVVYACVKLSDNIPHEEGWPDDPRPPRPGPAVPRQKDRRAA
jgi:hypothetical protein